MFRPKNIVELQGKTKATSRFWPWPLPFAPSKTRVFSALESVEWCLTFSLQCAYLIGVGVISPDAWNCSCLAFGWPKVWGFISAPFISFYRMPSEAPLTMGECLMYRGGVERCTQLRWSSRDKKVALVSNIIWFSSVHFGHMCIPYLAVY